MQRLNKAMLSASCKSESVFFAPSFFFSPAMEPLLTYFSSRPMPGGWVTAIHIMCIGGADQGIFQGIAAKEFLCQKYHETARTFTVLMRSGYGDL